jgi:hypothetical protein
MGIRVNGGLKSAIWRSLAAMAVFAQVLMLFTPLIEVRDTEAPGRVIAAGVTTPASASMASQRGRTTPHNATTCPACIAQSLFARVESGVRLPTLVVAERAPVDLRAEVLPHHDPPSTHHSRAPPVVS